MISQILDATIWKMLGISAVSLFTGIFGQAQSNVSPWLADMAIIGGILGGLGTCVYGLAKAYVIVRKDRREQAHFDRHGTLNHKMLDEVTPRS
jgi:hypothetical protein